MSYCPTCEQDLPETAFGVCRARKDGRNLYCKSCLRTKIARSRAVAKLQKESAQVLARKPMLRSPGIRLTVEERVFSAVVRGFETRCAIQRETKLALEEVCDALATLIFDERLVCSRSRGNERIFFARQQAA